MNGLGAITCYVSVGLNTPRIIPISCLESVRRNTHAVVTYSAHAPTDTFVVVGSLFWYSCSFAVLFTLHNPVSSCVRKAKTEQRSIYQLTVQLMEVMEPLNGSQRELIGHFFGGVIASNSGFVYLRKDLFHTCYFDCLTNTTEHRSTHLDPVPPVMLCYKFLLITCRPSTLLQLLWKTVCLQ